MVGPVAWRHFCRLDRARHPSAQAAPHSPPPDDRQRPERRLQRGSLGHARFGRAAP